MGRVTMYPDGSGVILLAKAYGAAFVQVWQLLRDGSKRTITNDLADYNEGLRSDGSAFVTVQKQTLSRLWTLGKGETNCAHVRHQQVFRSVGRAGRQDSLRFRRQRHRGHLRSFNQRWRCATVDFKRPEIMRPRGIAGQSLRRLSLKSFRRVSDLESRSRRRSRSNSRLVVRVPGPRLQPIVSGSCTNISKRVRRIRCGAFRLTAARRKD